MSGRRGSRNQPGLLPVRIVIILLLALTTAAAVGTLVWLAHGNGAEAGLAGLAAFAGAVGFFDRHLEHP